MSQKLDGTGPLSRHFMKTFIHEIYEIWAVLAVIGKFGTVLVHNVL